MDRGPDSNVQPVITGGPPPSDPPAADCDQIIYTSVRSGGTTGYRAIAASRDIDPSEAGEVIRRTPAVGGLCADTPDAVGVSFFGLSSGRYAVLHTVHAGREPSGRGDRRTYTHVFIIAPDGLRCFRNNPFALLRAAGRAGGLDLELEPPKALPRIRLTAKPEAPGGARWGTSCRPGTRWAGGLTDHLLSGGSMVITAEGDLLDVVELMLRSIPAPLRSQFSFSAGVPFSLSRQHRLVAVSDDDGQIRYRLEGSAYGFADVTAGTPPRTPISHPWARVVQRLIDQPQAERPPQAIADRFVGDDMDRLEPIAGLCMALVEARTAGIPGLLDLSESYVALNAPSELENSLACELITYAQSQACTLMGDAHRDSLTSLWDRAFALAAVSQAHAGWIAPIVLRLAARASEVDPLQAMRMMVRVEDDSDLAPLPEVGQARKLVSQGVHAWWRGAQSDTLHKAQKVLNDWCRRFEGDEVAAQTRTGIAERLGEGSEAPLEAQVARASSP